MAIDYTRIVEGSRAAQILSADIYGGWVSGITASAPVGGVFTGILNLISDPSQQIQTLNVSGYSKGTGDACPLIAEFEGVDSVGGANGKVLSLSEVSIRQTGFISRVDYPATGGSGTGLKVQFMIDRSGFPVAISAITDGGSGYVVNDIVTFSNEKNSITWKVDSVDESVGRYTTYALKRIYVNETQLQKDISEKEIGEGVELGVRRYHFGETIQLLPSQFGETEDTYVVTCTVTDVEYGLNFNNKYTTPITIESSFQLLYDRYDRVHYVRIQHDDGTVVIHGVNGEDYTPSPIV